ncbi:MAG: DUF1704 domain-containing protein [Bdellovibrionales bacterium]|nr:DUF1704 domain-containing protein [Bdellovibrionales bacterium]
MSLTTGQPFPSSGTTNGPRPSDIEALLKPYQNAAAVINTVGQQTRLISLLQPREANQEVQNAIITGKSHFPKFTYEPLSIDTAQLRNDLQRIIGELPTGSSMDQPTGILTRWHRDLAEELILKLKLLDVRGNLIPGEGSEMLQLSATLFGQPNCEEVDFCREKIQSLLLKKTGHVPSEHQEEILAAENKPKSSFSAFEVLEILEKNFQRNWCNGERLPLWNFKLNPNPDVTRSFNSPEDNTFYLGNSSFHRNRLPRFLRHELTHIARAVYGLCQPTTLQPLLSRGLAGFEPTEEGLAMTFEMNGGFERPEPIRMYARVIACDFAAKRYGPNECFGALRDFGLTPETAYSVTLGVYRGGGFLKDWLYFAGGQKVERLIKNGVDLSPLFVGKVGTEHLPEIEVLLESGILQYPHPSNLLPFHKRFCAKLNN